MFAWFRPCVRAYLTFFVCACVLECVRAYMRLCVSVCECACVRASVLSNVRALVCTCACLFARTDIHTFTQNCMLVTKAETTPGLSHWLVGKFLSNLRRRRSLNTRFPVLLLYSHLTSHPDFFDGRKFEMSFFSLSQAYFTERYT